ncbi:MAG: hypothetical protein CR988_07955 [Treponema sp.]|nr:MAG: hypothetical protein CR988_07955 [Treponema sp.]
MVKVNPVISKAVRDNCAYYTLNWSPLTEADKYTITTSVPAVAGVYELYRMDEKKKLNMLAVTHAWYGGLRSNIREAIDPYAKSDPERRALLENAELYYRYSCSNVFGDLLDVVWFLHTGYFPNKIEVEHSKRYKDIFLTENTPDILNWMDES